KFRLTQRTADPGAVSYVSSLSLAVTGGYYPNGYFESYPIDISQVGKAATTSFTWAPQQGAKVYARVSLDGGNVWTEWTEAAPSRRIRGSITRSAYRPPRDRLGVH